MGLIARLATLLVATSSIWTQPCAAQDVSKYKDASTNITFGMYGVDEIIDSESGDVAQGFYNFGMVLPNDALKKNANDYIGILVCPRG